MKTPSFRNYEIPMIKSDVSNEFISEMETLMSQNNNSELNTVNWFKTESTNVNRFSRIINQFNENDEIKSPFNNNNYETDNLSVLNEEKNSTESLSSSHKNE